MVGQDKQVRASELEVGSLVNFTLDGANELGIVLSISRLRTTSLPEVEVYFLEEGEVDYFMHAGKLPLELVAR